MEAILEAWAREMLTRYERTLMIKRDELSQTVEMPGAAVRQLVRDIEKRWRTDAPEDQSWNGSMKARNTAAQRPRVVPGVPVDPRSGVAVNGSAQQTLQPVSAVVASTTHHEIPTSAKASVTRSASGTADAGVAQRAASKAPEHLVPDSLHDPLNLTEEEISDMYGQPASVQGLELIQAALLDGGMGEVGQTYKLLTVPLEPPKPSAPADSSAAKSAGDATQKAAADTSTLQSPAAVVKVDAQPAKQQPLSAAHRKDGGPAGAAVHNTAAVMAHTQSATAEQEKKEAEARKVAEKKEEEKEEKEKLEDLYQQSATAEHTEAVSAALLAGGMGKIHSGAYPSVNAEHLRPSSKPNGQLASATREAPYAPPAETASVHETVGELPMAREARPVTVVRAAAVGAPVALARVDRDGSDAQHANESSPQKGESRTLTGGAAADQGITHSDIKAFEASRVLDLDELAEQVLHRFARRMELEAERRGVSAWE